MVEKIRKQPIIVAIIGMVIGYCGIYYLPYGNDNLSQSLIRIALSAIMIGIMAMMGAGKSFSNVKKFGWSVLIGLFFLVIAALPAIGSIGVAISKNNIPSNFITKEISYFLFALTIGVFEESMFRGVLLHGILRKTGKTRSGVWIAILVSSLVFGTFHVTNYIFGGNYDLTGILQTIGKILQTGIFGILLSAIYLKTKNFWGISFVHALNDFFAFQGLIFVVSQRGGYVQSGTAGNMMTLGYLVMFILYLPALIKAIKIVKQLKVPEYGLFKES